MQDTSKRAVLCPVSRTLTIVCILDDFFAALTSLRGIYVVLRENEPRGS
jgi:hypothetical protein